MECINQEWKPIKEYEGFYEINILGDVRRLSRAKFSKQNKKTSIGKILKTRINNCGYEEVRLSKEGKTSTKFIHKLLAQTFLENKNNKPEINHKNGIKTDNQLANLEWVTHS